MRGAERLAHLQGLNTDGENQFMPGQRRNVTYVSRLQSLQVAIDHQLGEMMMKHPNRRVAVITFNSEVTYIGDGSGDPVHITGDKLSEKDEVTRIATGLSLPKVIKETRNALGEQIFA